MSSCFGSSSLGSYSSWDRADCSECEKLKTENKSLTRRNKVVEVLNYKDCKTCDHFIASTVNSDPKNYTVMVEDSCNGFLILIMKYNDCTNYEGKKILIFKDVTLKEILDINKGLIDPHFTDNTKYISPIARFEPSMEGIKMARSFVENYN